MATVRIELPWQLQRLASCAKEVAVELREPVTLLAVFTALERSYPALRGTVIDRHSGQRRPKVRFFACGEDFSLQPLDTALPAAVAQGEEPLLIVGAISGG